MKYKFLIFLFAFIIIPNLVIASQVSTRYGFNMLPSTTFDNETAFVNQTDYWVTNEGILDNVADIILSWITPSNLDLSGYTLTTSFLNGIVGAIDMRGDPWYLSGTDFQIEKNLIVDKNITADYYYTQGSQLNSSHIPDHNGHTVHDTFNHLLNRGKSSAITVSLTGGLGISWTTGELYDEANNLFVSTTSGSGTLTDNQVNYLKWVSGTGLTLSTSISSNDEILVAIFSVYDGVINSYRETSIMSESVANTRRGLRELFPTRIISGMSVYEDTDVTNALDVTMDAGVFWCCGIEKNTPIEIKSRNTAMVRHFHTGGVWDYDTNAEINTTHYDDGNNLVELPAHKYVKAYFIFMNGKIGFIYPTTYYNTKAQAEASALSPIPPGLELIPKLTAIVYQQGDTDFTGTTWQDIRPGISEESFNIVSDHGSLAGLSDDDHVQYLLTDGTRAMTGNLNLSEYNITNLDWLFVNNVNATNLFGNGSELTGISTYNSTYHTTSTHVNQDVQTTASPVFVDLTITAPTNTNYKWTKGINANAVVLESQTLDNIFRYDWYTKRGDGGDSMIFRMVAKGTTTSFTNYEILDMMYDSAGRSWLIRSLSGGSGTTLPIKIYTGTNYGIKLDESGSIRMLDVYSNEISDDPYRDLYIDDGGELGYISSSIKTKENIKPTGDTSWIYDLNIVDFNYKNNPNGINQTGMIAEEVYLINKRLVSYERNITYEESYDEEGVLIRKPIKIETTNIPETVSYGNPLLISSLIKEMQNLKQENDLLKTFQQDICTEQNEIYNKYVWCDLLPIPK